MPGRSFRNNAAFDFRTQKMLLQHTHAFANEVPLNDPRLSPIRAKLKDLAPTLVVLSSAEIPRDDILALTSALESAGVEITRHVVKDSPHNPPVFATYHKNA